MRGDIQVRTLNDCCGGRELVGLNNTKYSAKKLLKVYCEGTALSVLDTKGSAFCVMSAAANHKTRDMRPMLRKRFESFKRVVEEKGLGTVWIADEWTLNPNYNGPIYPDHYILPGVFQPNNGELYKWYKNLSLKSVWTL